MLTGLLVEAGVAAIGFLMIGWVLRRQRQKRPLPAAVQWFAVIMMLIGFGLFLFTVRGLRSAEAEGLAVPPNSAGE